MHEGCVCQHYIFIIENRTLSTTNYRYNISTKCNKVHWVSVKCAVSNVQYTTYDHSQARKAIISSTCDLNRKFRSCQNLKNPSLIHNTMVCYCTAENDRRRRHRLCHQFTVCVFMCLSSCGCNKYSDVPATVALYRWTMFLHHT